MIGGPPPVPLGAGGPPPDLGPTRVVVTRCRRLGYHIDVCTDLTALNSPYWRLTAWGAARKVRRLKARREHVPESWTVTL